MGAEQSRNKTKNQEIIKYDPKFYICLNQTDGRSIKKETNQICYQKGKDNICDQNEKDKNCNQSEDKICNRNTEETCMSEEDVLSHCCVLLEVGTDVVKRVDDEGEIDVTDDASCNCHLYSYSRRFYPYILFYCSISKY